MTAETTLIESAAGRTPPTQAALADDLRALGLEPGATVIVHCAMSKLGWVVGGAPAVIATLTDVLGPAGTLVMPTHSSQLTEPANWKAPPVPRDWWPIIRDQAPAFDPAATPTRNMGVVAETFRRLPDVLRSGHPHTSFAARGPNAAAITRAHAPGCMMGEASPVGRLYELDAHVLLLGVDHGNNSSLHLAEYRADLERKPTVAEGAPMTVDGVRTWLSFEDLAVDDDDFRQIGEAFAAHAPDAESRGPVGWGQDRLARVRAAVDFAVTWMEANR